METPTEPKKGFWGRILRGKTKKITEEDIARVVEKTDKINKKFERGGPLHRFLRDARLLLSMVKDYWKGNYKKAPFWAVASVVATLLYVLNPFDLVADYILFFGLLDDAAVFATCLALVEKELKKYETWKTEEADKTPESP